MTLWQNTLDVTVIRRFPPPWTVEDLARHSVGWLEQPRDLGRLAVTPEEKRRHDRGTSSYSDLP
jgi:hypothetical protein